MSNRTSSLFSLPVLNAQQMRAESGANAGDTMSFAEDLVLDDVYVLLEGAPALDLNLNLTPDGTFSITTRTQTGTPGATVILDACTTWMTPDGKTTEILIFVELDADGLVADLFLLPLSPMITKTDYRLVGIDTQNPRAKLAAVACVSFTEGTHITMATGEQRRIEDLNPGDRVLTRDDGPQEVRWIGRSTMRAVGDFAPIRIASGVLHNTGDLIVSPEHRLFIYQRSDELGVGRSEVMVRARHMVNGTTITRLDGGFVDYYQLLFDSHQIIFAEGIAAETLLLDDRTEHALPQDMAAQFLPHKQAHATSEHHDLEVTDSISSTPDLAEILRRASTG
jgi:hypothetical protein